MLKIGTEVDSSPVTRFMNDMRSKSAALGASLSKSDFIPALGRITGKATEFQKSLAASNARVIAFGASAGSIYALRTAFVKLVESTVQVEKALSSINSLLNLGSRDLQSFSNNLFRIANQTGVSFQDAAKAATEFSRQGLGVEETLKRTSAALALSRLSGLGYEEAVSSLTGALNSFTKEALDAEDVVNRLASVDAKYAVSAGDLAKALSRVGASASDANVSFNETIALVTAAQQVTARGGSVIGNAFKTIFTRLQRPEVLLDLESAGVMVRNLQGEMLPLIQVLKNLSSTYDSLAVAQKSFVAEMVGGVYQINILKAIMADLGSNMSIFGGAMKTAEESIGSVDARLKILNNTISAQLIRTTNELEKSFNNIGTLLLGGSMRSGLDVFNSLLSKVTAFTDKSSTEDEGIYQKIESVGAQGLLKGVATILGGPAIQFALFAILKLFERLQKFVIDSTKDFVGLDQKAKEREAIEQTIVALLTQEKDALDKLVSGEETVLSKSQAILATLQKQNTELKLRATYASAMTNILAPSISMGKTAAGGFVPNLALDPEQAAARSLGYFAGRTLSTQVKVGSSSLRVLANANESKSTVIGPNGMAYDYIHPPEGTKAWDLHRANSIATNGIDPKLLARRPVAGGFVPNLAIPKSARSLGSGSYGEFFDYRKNIGGYSIGAKKFNTSYLDDGSVDEMMLHESVSKEYTTGKKLEALNKEGSLFTYPKIFGGLSGSMRAGRVGKEVLPGRNLWDASKSSIQRSRQFGRYEDLMSALQLSAFREMMSVGVHANDFIGHPGNTVFNDRALDIFDKINKNPNKAGKLSDRLRKNPRLQSQVGASMARQGARLGVVDPVYAGGFIPNLAFEDNFFQPNDLSEAAKQFLPGPQYDLFMKRAQKKGLIPKSKEDLRKWLGGVAVGKTGFEGFSSESADAFASIMTRSNIAGERMAKQSAINTKINPADAQEMLSWLAPQFPMIAAYAQSSNVKPFKNYSYVTPFQAGENSFRVPLKFLSHSQGPALYEKLMADAKTMGFPLPKESMGSVFGNIFDASMKNFFQERGVPVGGKNAALDIMGYHPDIAQYIGTNEKFSGAEIKASIEEGITSMPGKIFRTLVGDDAGRLVGPSSKVPPILGVNTFNEKRGNIGILDRDTFQSSASRSTNSFESLLYGAMATRRPLMVQTGPMGAGKLAAAKGMGGKMILSQADLAGVEQLLLNTTSQADTGVYGLAYGLASKIKAFRGSIPSLRARMISEGRKENPNATIHEGTMQEFEALFARLEKEMGPLGRLSYMSAAGGFISPLGEALRAENSMTGGRGRVGSHPLLVSPSNPMGLAAFDSNQGTVGNAINQHSSRQSLGQIKRQRSSAGGFIPNLAEGEIFGTNLGNSVMLSLVGFASQLNYSRDIMSKVNSKYGFFLNSHDKELQKMNLVTQEYSRLHKSLLKQETAQVFFTSSLDKSAEKVRFTSPKEMEDKFGASIQGYSEALNKEKSRLETSKQSTFKAGLFTSFGGAMLGGMASSIAGKFSPTAGAAFDNLTTAATNAGQALVTFPNRIGKTIAGGIAGAGITQSLDTWMKGLEGSRFQLELQTSKTQKFISKLDALTRTLGEYDTLVHDSAVPLRVLNQETVKYINLLSELKTSSATTNGEGKVLAARIESAPTSAAKIGLLQEARALKEKELEKAQLGQLIMELSGKRSGLGMSSGTFSYNSELEKSSVEQNISSIAGGIVNQLSEEVKTSLKNNVTQAGTFRNILNNDKTSSSFINSIGERGKGEQDIQVIVQKMRNIMAQQQMSSLPEAVSARETLTQQNSVRQQRLEMVTQREQSLRRLYINQGSFATDNALGLRGLAAKQSYGKTTLEAEKTNALMPLLQQQFGERSIRSLRTSMELNQVSNEGQFKEGEIARDVQGSLKNIYVQSFDSMAKNLTATQLGAKGLQSTINPSSQVLIEGLNTGLAKVLGQGNILKDFKTPTGGFNFEAFEKMVAASSGTSIGDQSKIQKYMESNRSPEVLKAIQQGVFLTANNTLDTAEKSDKIVAGFEAFRQEMNFKQLANFMGGMKNFMDRDSRRTFRQDIVRGLSLMEKGTNPEIKGQGAMLFLNKMKESNVAIDLSGKNPLSKLMSRAFSTAQSGISFSQDKSFNEMSGMLQRLGLSKETVSGFKGYKQAGSEMSALASLQLQLQPENAKMLQAGDKDISTIPKQLNEAFSQTSKEIKGFGESLVTTGKQVKSALQDITDVRKLNAASEATDLKRFTDVMEKIAKRFEGATQEPELKKQWNIAGSLPSVGGAVAGAAITGAIQLFAYNRLGKLLAQQAAYKPQAQYSSSKYYPVNFDDDVGVPRGQGPYRPYNPVSRPGTPIFMPGVGGEEARRKMSFFQNMKNRAGKMNWKGIGKGGMIASAMMLPMMLQAGEESGGTSALGTAASYGGLASMGMAAANIGSKFAGPVGLGTSVAYGSFSAGQALYKSRMGDVNLSSRGFEIEQYVQSRLMKGDSNEKMTQYLDKLIKTNDESAKSLDGWQKAFSPTANGQLGSLQSSTQELKAIRANLDVIKQNGEQQKALENAAKTGEPATVNSNMKVEISLKDAANVPDMIMKTFIEPLKAKLAELQAQVVNLQSINNVTVAPAAIE